MSSDFPRSPRLLKGAIVAIESGSSTPNVIVFQYNPQTLTRSLEATTPTGGQSGARSEALRLAGAPKETINLDVEIDATDQLEAGEQYAVSMGIYPQLSALEMLLYPKSSYVVTNTALLEAGVIEIIPPLAPFTLFIWGPKRIVPVRLTSFSITEEAHDTRLNPIRAKVSLGLQVLSYNDFPLTHPGYHVFLAHQVAKETMAKIGSARDIAAAVGEGVSINLGGA
jgi:hypothetical protein